MESSFNIILAFDWALGVNARPKGVTKVIQFKGFASFMNIIKGLVTKPTSITLVGGSSVLFTGCVYSENKFSICFFRHLTEKKCFRKGNEDWIILTTAVTDELEFIFLRILKPNQSP